MPPVFDHFLHAGILKNGDAFLAGHGTGHFAGEIALLDHVPGVNINLVAVFCRVIDGGAVDDAIHPRPERGGHAHGAWLAGGEQGVSLQ